MKRLAVEQRLACPACRKPFRVPAAPVVCRDCEPGAILPADVVGKMARCVKCHKIIGESAPEAAVAPTPPVPAPTPTRPRFPVSPKVLTVAAGGALLLVAAVVGASYLRSSSPPAANPGDEPVVVAPPAAPDADLAILRAAKRGVFSARVADLWASPPVRQMWGAVPKEMRDLADRTSAEFGFDIAEVERVSVALDDVSKLDVLAVVRLSKPWDEARRKKLLSQSPQVGWRAKSAGGKEYHLTALAAPLPDAPKEALAVHAVDDALFVAGPEASVVRFLEDRAAGKARPDGPLAPLVEKLGRDKPHLVVSGAFTPDDFRVRSWKDVRTAALSVTAGEKNIAFDGTMSFADEASAAAYVKLVELLQDTTKGLADLAPTGLVVEAKGAEQLTKWIEKVQVGREDTRLRLGLLVPTDTFGQWVTAAAAQAAGKIGPGFGGDPAAVGAAADRLTGAKNLRDIAAALEKYHDGEGRYPPLAFEAGGRRLYSWRVCLLPYLGDEGAKVYKALDKSKAWDEGDNAKLLAKMPEVFSHPAVRIVGDRGGTVFQVLSGPGGSFRRWEKLTRDSFPRGRGNTVAVVVASRPVHWAAPGDDVVVPADEDGVAKSALPLIADNPPLPLGVNFDGSVRPRPAGLTAKAFAGFARP